MSICGPALHAIYIIVKCSGEDQRRKGDNAYQYKIRPGVGPAASLLDASWKATRAMSQANGSNISARFHMCVHERRRRHWVIFTSPEFECNVMRSVCGSGLVYYLIQVSSWGDQGCTFEVDKVITSVYYICHSFDV